MSSEVTRKQCKIHYRQAVVVPPTGALTLEAMVRSALAVEVDGAKLRDRAVLRRRHDDDGSLDEQATVLVCLQDVNPGSRGSYIFSALVGFRPGAEQGLLDAGDGPDLPIQAFAPPDGQHFIDFMVFSLIKGDHVLVLQGPNARRRSLEEYLSWLLQKRTEVLPLDRSLVLRTKIELPRAAKAQQRITKIRIGGHGSPADKPLALAGDLPREKRGRKGFRLGRIRSVLDEVFGETATGQLLANLGEDAQVSLQVTLGFPGKSEAEQPGVPITQIEDAIRNLDEGEVALIGEDGTIIGEEVRSHHGGRIEMINGLPEPESVKKLMREAYAAFLERGLIVPETLSVGQPPS